MQTWQSSAILVLAIKIIIAVIAAILLGNGSVVAFNHIPQKWFEDWNEEAGTWKKTLPKKLLDADNFGKQRLPSNPWKWAFTGLFGICGIYLAITAPPQFEIATLIVMAIVLGMAISDQLYTIVPDQYFILLAVSALGFIAYNEKWWEPIAGAGIGLLLGLSVLGLGLLIHRRVAIGGADIKFYTCMGLVAGRRGIIVIFVLTTILFALQNAFRIATRKGNLKDSVALMPAALVATTVYFIFLWNLSDMIQL